MPDYTYDNLDAGIAELRRKAIWVALKQADIGPDEKTGTAPRTPEEKATASKIEEFFGLIPAQFTPFKAMPEAAEFHDLSRHLVAAADYLCTTQPSQRPTFDIPATPQTAFSGITSARSILEHWSGAAAREFTTNYLDPLPYQLLGQFNLVGAAAKLMDEEAKIWDQARLDVAQILNKGIDAVDALDTLCDSHTWAVVLTAVVSLATIASVPVAGVAAAEWTLASVDAGGSLATALLPGGGEKKTLDYRGSTPDQVIACVGQALQGLADTIVHQENQIADLLHRATKLLTDGHTRGTFVPRTPKAAGTTKANFKDDDHFGTAS